MFKTTHRALEKTGHRCIFVNEFTSLPYEFLAAIVYNNAAEEIFLVGDVKQTKVLEPDGGMHIGNHIDLSGLSRHLLCVNFRNPKDVVAFFLMRLLLILKLKGVLKFWTLEICQKLLPLGRHFPSKVQNCFVIHHLQQYAQIKVALVRLGFYISMVLMPRLCLLSCSWLVLLGIQRSCITCQMVQPAHKCLFQSWICQSSFIPICRLGWLFQMNHLLNMFLLIKLLI